jgi:AraC family transcriptional regulator
MLRDSNGAALASAFGARRFEAKTHHKNSTASPSVQVSPSNIIKRQAIAWDGMAAEIVQTTKSEKLEFRFRSSFHLLAVYEQGARNGGDSFVEGLPRSTLRDVKRKLIFVPAGHEYHECHDPRVLTRVAFFYFDPTSMPQLSDAESTLTPRLFFENTALRETALKLMTLIENGSQDNLSYIEALGAVLAHELVRLDQGVSLKEAPVRGGLAAWQQRVVTTYIEEHLAESIPLAKLAELVRLSPYYFCRAFKQSFGLPPHKYHNSRRIEHAKMLLAKSSPSVTDIGLTIGFSETSSFTAAFRKATGLTPTAYHRSLS